MRGGTRPGAGRKKGIPNKANAIRQKMVAASGETPLNCLLSFMRAPEPIREQGESETSYRRRLSDWQTYRFEAAKAAAPYVHPRLAAVTHTPTSEELRARCFTVRIVRPGGNGVPEKSPFFPDPPTESTTLDGNGPITMPTLQGRAVSPNSGRDSNNS